MCGIAGAISTHQPRHDLDSLVWSMVQHQHRRGPDHQAVIGQQIRDGSVVFGHSRLSIIDLSSAAHQPMWDVGRRYLITYNGEIYNYLELKQELTRLGHAFTTQSDTEVILEAFKAWGTEAFNRFNGMFAFALLDVQVGKVWLVRDRFGVKPLLYSTQQNNLFFASTAGPIAKHFRCRPNLPYLSRGIGYLIYEDGSDETPYEGVKALKSGHYLEISWGQNHLMSKLSRYYDLSIRTLEKIQMLADLKEAQVVELVKETLTSAVRFRLRADVPVAVSLSGGLDSSTVSVLAAEAHPQINGFSFALPEAPESEGPLVKLLENHCGIGVHYVWPRLPSSQLEKLFFDTLAAQDAPFPGLSVMAQNLVYKAAHEHGYKVLLGGQGSDESFMGYRKFQWFYLQYLIHTKQFKLALPQGLFLGKMLMEELPQARLYWSQHRRYLLSDTRTSQVRLPPARLNLNADPSKPLWVRQVDDICRYSLPTLLRYEDRNSMGHSIESRLPFMDYRLVELGLALPEALKLRYGYGKWVLRDLIRPKLPREIWATRYKRGFDVKQNWIDSGLGGIIRSAIFDSRSRLEAILEPGLDISKAYSDESLKKDHTALGEAITLVWLTNRGG